jgi:DNA-binding MarR family transcriptional regulator
MSSDVTHEKKRQQLLSFVKELAPGVDPEAIQLGGLMHRIGHALYQMNEESLEEAELTFAQYRILMDLRFGERFNEYPGMNPSDLSERLGVTRNTVSSLIRSLEEKGLIARQLDADDRRRFIIELTEAGRERVHQHASRHFGVLSDCFGVLDQDEKEQMIKLLRKLGEHPQIDLTGVK